MIVGLSVTELVMVVAASALILSGLLPVRRRRLGAVMLSTVFVSSAAAQLTVGLRWQLTPVVIATFPWLVAAVHRIVTPPARQAPHRVLATVAAAVALVLVAAGVVTAWALPTPSFPTPSGRYAVGVTVAQWTDHQRPELATADEADHRMVVAQIWYPAHGTRDADRSRYLGRTEHEARLVSAAEARYLGLPGFALSHLVHAHATALPDTQVLATGEKLPIVLFSPGLGGVRTQNTAWAEELASRGYAVAALDHPYDSAAVTFTNGRTVGTQVAATGDDAEDNRRAAQWTAIRAADLSFALTQLTSDPPPPLKGRLDSAQAAVTGHSLGGAAALLAARQDQRFTAVINIDGYPRDPTPSRYDQPALAITHELHAGDDPAYPRQLDEVLQLSTTAGYRLEVPGTTHLSFTDAPLFLPPIPTLIGTHGRQASTRLTADITTDFLNATRSGSTV